MPRPSTPEDIAAKVAFMNAYFEDALGRAAFLEDLADNGHEYESMTLCVVYLDSYSQLLSGRKGETGRNFVETVCSHDQSGFLSLIHPLQLTRSFDEMKGRWPQRSRILSGRYPGPTYALVSREDALDAIRETFASEEVAEIIRELWRGTVAAVVYNWVRNPSVHGPGGSQQISFDKTTLKGAPAPSVSLNSLLPPLRAMITEARSRSLKRCEWFGDDRTVYVVP
jgi:hypothetical protein